MVAIAEVTWKLLTSNFPFLKFIILLIKDLAKHSTGVWNGTLEWKMEWNSECTQF